MMNKYISNKWMLSSLLLCIVLLSSCSLRVEKRRYRSGYYIDYSNNLKLNHQDRAKSIDLEIDNRVHEQQIPVKIPGRDVEILSLAENTQMVKSPITLTKIVLSSKTDCDIIYLKNGTTLEVTNIKIDEAKVTYRNCGNNHSPEGPIYNNQIKKIKLANGAEVIPSKEMADINHIKARRGEDKKDKEKVNATSVLAWIFGGIAIALGVAAIVLFATAAGGGWGGIINLLIGGILALIALIFMIVAIVIGAARRR